MCSIDSSSVIVLQLAYITLKNAYSELRSVNFCKASRAHVLIVSNLKLKSNYKKKHYINLYTTKNSVQSRIIRREICYEESFII